MDQLVSAITEYTKQNGLNYEFSLDKYKEELMNLEGFGEKSIIKLLASIEKSKENDLAKRKATIIV